MKIAIISNGSGWHEYLGEILKLEGLSFFEQIEAQDVSRLDAEAAILAPGCEPEGVEQFLSQGGGVICFRPEKDTLRLASLEDCGQKPGPLQLRLTEPLALAGLGADLPIQGPATTYRSNQSAPESGYLLVESDYGSPSPGLIERQVGKGRLVIFAYDLPECVMRLRQGEPERKGLIPDGDSIPRPCHLYSGTSAGDAGWIPYADFHCMLLGDVVRRLLSVPVPSFWRLPADAPGALILSGDDDDATTEMREWEMRDVEAMGGKMSLYLLPGRSKCEPEDVERWRRRGHEVSVHPDLVPERPDAERMLAKLRQDIAAFKKRWRGEARTVRMHCVAWPGYTEPAEVLEEMGVRMESNFFPLAFPRSRARAPYFGMGAAMPMPFARPDGSLVRVWQQPGHLEDDALFGKTQDYSQKLSSEAWKAILDRIFGSIARYFHCVYCANIHPVNYLRFSGEQGRDVMRAAAERGFPILSMEEWLDFWAARDAWRLSAVTWQEGRLSFTVGGPALRRTLSVAVPASARGPVRSVEINGLPTPTTLRKRFLRETCFVPIAPGTERADVVVTYQIGG